MSHHSSGPRQKPKNRKPPKQQPGQDRNAAAGLASGAVPPPPCNSDNPQNPSDNGAPWYRKWDGGWKRVLEIGGLLVGVTYVALTYGLWQNSGASLDVLKREFSESQRPRIVVVKLETMSFETKMAAEPEVGEPLTVNIQYKNTGKTPAYHLRVRRHVLFGPHVHDFRPDILVNPQIPDETTLDPDLPDAVVTTATSVKDPYAEITGVIDPRDLLPWDGSKPVVAFGIFLYSDEAGTNYCTPFIYDYLVDPPTWAAMDQFLDEYKEQKHSAEELCPSGYSR